MEARDLDHRPMGKPSHLLSAQYPSTGLKLSGAPTQCLLMQQ